MERKDYTLKNKKFKVVGIIEREYKGLNSSLFGGAEQERGISYTYGDFNGKNIIPKEAITYDVILRFTGNELLAGKKLEYLMMDLKLGRMSVNPNGNYLSAMYSINDIRDLTNINENNLILISTVILLVFNMLNIIWGEYLREISMLRLIGARKRDIRLMVVYQSILLAIIGIAIGIIVGLGITEIGINVFKDTTLELAKLKPKMHIDLDVVSKTITVSVLAIVLATIIPVIKIGRVGCMEAVSNSLKTKNKGKQSKVGNFIQNRLGIYRYMGVRNLWLKKTRTLVSILTISLCGYLIIYTFSSMQDEVDDKIRRIYYKYDMEFRPGISNDIDEFKISEDKIEKIKNMDGVKEVKCFIQCRHNIYNRKKNINKIFIDYYGIKESEKIEFESYLRFLNNEDIQEKVEPYMLEEKKSKDILGKTDGYINVAVFNSFYDVTKTNTYHSIYKNLKVGDIIDIGVNYHNGDKIEKRNVKVRVGAILKDDWQSYGDSLSPDKFEVITSENNMKELLGFKAYNNLTVDYKDIDNLAENRKIEKYARKNIPGAVILKESFYNDQKQANKNIFRESMINITLILMIAAISIFCTVKSNLLERRKEIFTMRALGMSAKDMSRMNMWESMTYALLSVLSGIGLATYALFKFVEWNNNAYTNFGIEHFMDFTFPYPQAIIFAVVTLATCIIAVKLANRDFKNKEISDGMRDIDS